MKETTLGERIRAARKRAGLTQEQVAEATGSGRAGTVNGWERKGIIPEGSALMVLPHLLNVDGHWLLTGEGDPKRSEPTDRDAFIKDVESALRKLKGG